MSPVLGIPSGGSISVASRWIPAGSGGYGGGVAPGQAPPPVLCASDVQGAPAFEPPAHSPPQAIVLSPSAASRAALRLGLFPKMTFASTTVVWFPDFCNTA